MKIGTFNLAIATFVVVVALGLTTKRSVAATFSTWGKGQLEEEFKAEDRFVEFKKTLVKTYNDPFCRGAGLTTMQKITGELNDSTRFELNDNGTIEVYGELQNFHALVSGVYKGSFSFCRNFKEWLGVSADALHLHARILPPETPNATTSGLKVVVLSSKFENVHVGRHVPKWFENIATSMVNEASRELWRTKLGHFFEKMISKGIVKIIDNAEQPVN